MKKIIPIIFFLVFAVIGVGMLIGSFSILNMETSAMDGAEEITAYITDIQIHRDSDGDVDHDVFVTYEYDGVTYEDQKITSYSSDMYIGEELILFYNPLRPTLLIVKGHEYFGFRMTLFMGIVFFLVGISYPFYQLIANLRKKHIVKSGCVLHATIEDIARNTSVRVNGQSPYVIYCSYYDALQNLTYRFKSDNLWTDPGYVYRPGDPIQVVADPKNYKRYHVMAEERINQRIVDYT
ncbi:MAG: DUF3592 domain-containing protein [Roseburia inulinivorans]|nr:DUF3592 domain-containing protein [Roseburia inulinivorans]